VEPTVVDPPAAVVPPDELPFLVPLPTAALRLIVPETLAVSELVPPLDSQAASEMLITARRQIFGAFNSVANLYVLHRTQDETQCWLKSLVPRSTRRVDGAHGVIGEDHPCLKNALQIHPKSIDRGRCYVTNFRRHSCPPFETCRCAHTVARPLF
jgi:hypothetical protein